jgi:hypothetical protein
MGACELKMLVPETVDTVFVVVVGGGCAIASLEGNKKADRSKVAVSGAEVLPNENTGVAIVWLVFVVANETVANGFLVLLLVDEFSVSRRTGERPTTIRLALMVEASARCVVPATYESDASSRASLSNLVSCEFSFSRFLRLIMTELFVSQDKRSNDILSQR